ncbi:MAG TPA: xanthine dehydrogenase family protein subunit M [Rhizomicrobium sp.]|nr:xanthine dehydrogenase family protein subunit M [Rhizomicrobium sp.]
MRPFSYQRVSDAAAAVRAQGAFLAGGTTLLDLMKLDVMQPHALVDINDLSGEFGAIDYGSQGLRLGALVHMNIAARHPDIVQNYPVISQSLLLAASAQLRNMASLGGNVLQRTRCSYFRDTSWSRCNKRNPGSGCAALEGVNRKHAVLGTSPNCIATYPGDFAQALVALDAVVETAGPQGARRIAFADLHVPPGDDPSRENTLRPGELITFLVVPALPFARRSLYLKIRDRQSYEFALTSAAVALDLNGDTVREARIALGGVATRPWRAREAEASLRGKPLNQATAQAAAQAAFSSAVTHGGNDFKPELGRRTLVRALLEAGALRV